MNNIKEYCKQSLIYRFNLFFNYTEPPKVNLDALFGAKEIRVKAGEPLTIPIGISGAPTPTCTWNKNGSPVDSRVSYSIYQI